MYKIDLRQRAYKDLQGTPKTYARLIARHIDLLEQNPRPPDSKKLKGESGYSLRVGTYYNVHFNQFHGRDPIS